MALNILNDIDARLFQGISRAYQGGRRVSLLAADGSELVAGEQPSAPVIGEQPAILPAGAAIGNSISLHLGAASGVPAPTASWDLTRDGISIRDQVDEFLALELTEPGRHVLSVTWANDIGEPVAAVPTELLVVVEAPAPAIDYAAVTLAYFDANTPFEGSAGDVTAINALGSGGWRLAKTGTGAPIQRSDAGFVLADGAFLQSQVLSALPASDGHFVVAELTLDAYGSAPGQIVEGQGDRIRLRNNAGNLQAIGQVGALPVHALGTASYGSRVVIAAMIDDVADLFISIGASGSETATAVAVTDPVLGRFALGRYLVGTLHRLAVVGRPEGGNWPVTMQQVHADFLQGA